MMLYSPWRGDARIAGAALIMIVLTMSGIDLCEASPSSRYLIISSPKMTQVYYAKLLSAGDAALRKKLELRPLTLPGATKMPTGVATDNARMVVYVADPGSSTIVAVPVFINEAENGKLVTGDIKVVVTGCAAHWVAVDGKGNLFYTEPDNNDIKTVPGVSLDKLIAGQPVTIEPVSLYAAAGTPAVASVQKPQGIAVDNFNLYWGNSETGTTVGSIMMGYEVPPDLNKEKLVKLLSQNENEVYGVCMSAMHIFYTGSSLVYGMRRSGGTAATITDKLQAPRGCTWDGDGTIYIADKDGNGVYAFAGDTPSLSPRGLVKALDVKDPYGLATLSGAWRLPGAGLALAAALLFHSF